MMRRPRSSRTRDAGLLSVTLLAWVAGCSGEAGKAPSPAGSPPVAKTSPGPAPTAPSRTTTQAPPKKSSIVGDDRAASVSPTFSAPAVPQEPSPFRFAEIAREAGVDFVQYSGMTKDKHFPTANSSGVALFDYDNDGRLDIYFATATQLPLGTSKNGPNRLYRNLGNNKFEDVTAKAGVGFAGFCHGAIVGDLDNDGDRDLFLCNYGGNVYYRNNGNGTFTDATKAARFDGPGWSSSGACLDYDNDGDLDLYISNYGEWKYPEDSIFCGDTEKQIRLYCSPRSIRTVKHLLYRNNGDGTFTDVYDSFLVNDEGKKIPGRNDGHGFGVVTADVNGDGLVDIYVANDMNPNFLFVNQGNGTFLDATESSGAALDVEGRAQSGMGVDCEDIDGDGDFDLFVTNFANEYNTLYINLTDFKNKNLVSYSDMTSFYGLAADSMPTVGWGCVLGDFDSDGWPDSFVTNGHVDDNRSELGQSVEYAELPLLHRNEVKNRDAQGRPLPKEQVSQRFRLATRDVGPYFSTKHVGRGLAFGDIDNDGDLDIVVNHKDGVPAILRNDTPHKNHWIRFNLTGTKSNREAIGTLVTIEGGDHTIVRQRKGGCSMLSSNDPRVLVGLGSLAEIPKVTVRWPSGKTTVLEKVKVDQTLELSEPK